MAVTTIEAIRFEVVTAPNKYEVAAMHYKIQAGIMKSSLESSPSKFILLNWLRVLPEPDYRQIGIAKTFIDNLIAFGQRENFQSIHGYVSAGALLQDNREHVVKYLRKFGFQFQGNDFWLDL